MEKKKLIAWVPTCLGSLKFEQYIRGNWVHSSAITHPSQHGIRSAAGTDPGYFGYKFVKNIDFVPSVCYAPARRGAAPARVRAGAGRVPGFEYIGSSSYFRLRRAALNLE